MFNLVKIRFFHHADIILKVPNKSSPAVFNYTLKLADTF